MSEDTKPVKPVKTAEEIKFEEITKQEIFVSILIKHGDIQDKIFPVLRSKLTEEQIYGIFTESSIRDIFNILGRSYFRYGVTTPAELRMLVDKDDHIMLARFDRLIKHDRSQYKDEMLIDELDKYIRNKMIYLTTSDAFQKVHDDDYDELQSNIDSINDSINFTVRNDDVGYTIGDPDSIDVMLDELNKEVKGVESSIELVNQQTTSKGWPCAAVSVLMGQTCVGKTIMLCNEAAYAYTHGYNVLFISLEQTKAQISQRIISNITDIEHNEIKNTTCPDLETKLHNPKYGNVEIHYLAPNSDVSDVAQLVKSSQKKHDINIVMIDYLMKLRPSKYVYEKKPDSYSAGFDIYQNARHSIAVEFGVALLTVSQIGRDGYYESKLTMKNVAGSTGVNEVSDFILTIGRDEQMHSMHMVQHEIIKNRFGPTEGVTLSHIDYEHMRVNKTSKEQMEEYSETRLNQKIPLNETATKKTKREMENDNELKRINAIMKRMGHEPIKRE